MTAPSPVARPNGKGWVLRARAWLAYRVRQALADLAPARHHRLALAADRLDRDLGHRTGILLLDAGCQAGPLSRRVARRHPDWSVVAADLDPVQLHALHQEARAAHLDNVLPVRLDLTAPLPVGPFDAIAAIECLSEIPDDRAALRTMAAGLRPGGLLYVHVPRDDWRPVLPGSPDQWYSNVRRGYSPQGLSAALGDLGLEIVETQDTTFVLIHAAEEFRFRWLRRASRPVRLLALPALRLAAWTEGHGVRLGRPRGLFVVARRPA